jgi:hypothetical protein
MACVAVSVTFGGKRRRSHSAFWPMVQPAARASRSERGIGFCALLLERSSQEANGLRSNSVKRREVIEADALRIIQAPHPCSR